MGSVDLSLANSYSYVIKILLRFVCRQSALDALDGGGNLTIPKMRQRFIFTLNDSQQSLILSKLCVTSTADFVKFKTAIGPAISADKVNA